MTAPSLEPTVASVAPEGEGLTDYDREHLITYLRLLDAEKERAGWREITQLVLRLDPADQPDRARRAYDTHLARARWISTNGYFDLLG